MADDLIVIAVLLGAHGVQGNCRVKSFTGFAEDAFSYGPLLGEDGRVLLSPVNVRAAKDHFIVTPKEALQKEGWDALKGTLLYVPREVLPSTDDDEIYIDELIGVDVFDEAGEPLGAVKAVQNYGAGDLLEITPVAGGKTVLVPFTEQDVPEIDLDAGRLIVTSYALWADESGAPEQNASETERGRPKAGPRKKLK